MYVCACIAIINVCCYVIEKAGKFRKSARASFMSVCVLVRVIHRTGTLYLCVWPMQAKQNENEAYNEACKQVASCLHIILYCLLFLNRFAVFLCFVNMFHFIMEMGLISGSLLWLKLMTWRSNGNDLISGQISISSHIPYFKFLNMS